MRKGLIDAGGLAAIAAALAVILGSCAMTGCAPGTQSDATTMQMAQQALAAQAQASPMPAEISGGVKDVIQMMKDQGVLDKWLANCRAHGINPGLKIEKGIVTYYKIGLDGFDGDFEARLEGNGTKLPTGTRTALLEALKAIDGRTDADSNALRDKILALLGWNRTAEGGNTVETPSGGAKPAP